jgi:hypothetical protein
VSVADVPVIKAWPEARPYLVTLRGTVDGDIRPLLATAGAAPFAISREILSYVDHLGHLYTGKSKVGQRSKDYLVAMMSKADPNYAKRAGEIYEMYRCGSVHEFAPKVITNSKGQSLGWLCYKGDRSARIVVEDREVSVVHLGPLVSVHGGRFWLPVSTVCLIDDLVASIDMFVQSGPEADRVAAWNAAAQHLGAPVPYEFVV